MSLDIQQSSSSIGLRFSAKGCLLQRRELGILSSKLPLPNKFFTKLDYRPNFRACRFWRLEWHSGDTRLIGDFPGVLLLDWLNLSTLNFVLYGDVSWLE